MAWYTTIHAQETTINNPLEWIDFEFGEHGIWQSKNGTHGPGPKIPNQWDKSNVIVNENGELLLKISNHKGQWYSSEVRTKECAKYGTYILDMVLLDSIHLDVLDANIIIGVFFYEGINEKEFDIEFAKWGYPNEIRNTECSIHSPLGSYSSLFHTGSVNDTNEELIYRKLRAQILWTANQITYKVFRTIVGDAGMGNWELQGEWKFSSNYENYDSNFIPKETDNMHLHFNFWLMNGLKPTNNKESRIMITNYQYLPQ